MAQGSACGLLPRTSTDADGEATWRNAAMRKDQIYIFAAFASVVQEATRFSFSCSSKGGDSCYCGAGIKMYVQVAGAQSPKMLKQYKLVGAIIYDDGQHNDARMNLAIALTAARYGAAIANYTEVVHLRKRAESQTGEEGEGLRRSTAGT
ncbi:glycerol-3-phosphate dehydrogenase, mitochondrial-like [Genypterus blacodes]|uniref:glycerol-3-phosphate dehydrogenase, mitochondrial-like n=1 Tax=Genypterus blacodes TaxID=154954 RepID=UPI003F7704C1